MSNIALNLLALLLCSHLALASDEIESSQDTDPLNTLTEPATANSKAPQKEGMSVAPVVGYDPTYGFVYGGAYFYEGEKFSFGTDFNLNFKQVYVYHIHAAYKLSHLWEVSIRSGVDDGFDPYYGEGGETSVSNYTKLWGINSRSELQLKFNLTPVFSLAAFGDGRFRTEQAIPTEAFVRRFPNEENAAVGLTFAADTRRNGENSYNGFLFTTSATYAPKNFSDVAQAHDFSQIESVFIVYKEILEEIIPKVTAAFAVKGGFSDGDPSYMYRYRLGGATNLRGYLENRFRGKKYYEQQTELRFPIWKPLSGATFVSFGDAADVAFTNPKLAYGFGLRIGLPPDWVDKVRIDFGVGRDQQGVFAEWGQTF